MPPRENNLNDLFIGWMTTEGNEIIGKVKSSIFSDDGFTCTVELNDLKKEKKMKYNLKNVTSISIERSYDDGTVTATAYGRDPYCPGHVTVIKRASAKCGPNDIYDFNIGAKLAIDRLYEGYDMTPKPKRKPYNGKIFVENFLGSSLMPHRIYNVRDGVIVGVPMNGSDGLDPFIFKDMTDTEMSIAVFKRFFDKHASDITASIRSRCYFVRG